MIAATVVVVVHGVHDGGGDDDEGQAGSGQSTAPHRRSAVGCHGLLRKVR